MNSDPYGFYNLWLKSMRDGQEQMMKAGSSGMLDSSQAWKQWLDGTMAIWRKTAEMGPDPLGLTEQWLKMMERVQEKLLAGETVPADPFSFFKEWYEAISDSWSKVVEDTFASEKFLEFNKQFMESYTSFSKAFRGANEEYLKILQLPSRSDVSHVGELVVALEEKVDQLEDRFEDVEDVFSQTAKSEAVAGLTQRLEQVETKLDRVLTELAKIETFGVNGQSESNAAAPRKAQKKKTIKPQVNVDKSEAGS